MGDLANSYAALGRQSEASSAERGNTQTSEDQARPRSPPDTLKSMNNLASNYAALGRLPEALALREEMLKLRTASWARITQTQDWLFMYIACTQRADDRQGREPRQTSRSGLWTGSNKPSPPGTRTKPPT